MVFIKNKKGDSREKPVEMILFLVLIVLIIVALAWVIDVPKLYADIFPDINGTIQDRVIQAQSAIPLIEKQFGGKFYPTRVLVRDKTSDEPFNYYFFRWNPEIQKPQASLFVYYKKWIFDSKYMISSTSEWVIDPDFLEFYKKGDLNDVNEESRLIIKAVLAAKSEQAMQTTLFGAKSRFEEVSYWVYSPQDDIRGDELYSEINKPEEGVSGNSR